MKRTVLVKRRLHLKQRETLSTEPRADFFPVGPRCIDAEISVSSNAPDVTRRFPLKLAGRLHSGTRGSRLLIAREWLATRDDLRGAHRGLPRQARRGLIRKDTGPTHVRVVMRRQFARACRRG